MNLQDKRSSGKSGNRFSLVEDSPANRIHVQENVKRLVMIVISGQNCGESFARLNPDGSWVRMFRGCVQVRMDDSLEEYSGTWSRWGIVSGGEAGELLMSEPAIGGNGCSLLLTPSTVDIAGGKDRYQKRVAYRESIGRNWVAGSLSEQIAMLPTLTSRDHKDSGKNTDYRKVAMKSKLAGKIVLLPTVTTPRPHDNEETVGKYLESQNQKDLTYAIGKNHGLKLQPAFAEWMMGFPIGWTALDASETPLSRSKSIRSSGQSRKLKGGRSECPAR